MHFWCKNLLPKFGLKRRFHFAFRISGRAPAADLLLSQHCKLLHHMHLTTFKLSFSWSLNQQTHFLKATNKQSFVVRHQAFWLKNCVILLLESPCSFVRWWQNFSCMQLHASGVLDAAWAPEGREGQSQAGPKGHQLEVGARRAP